MNFVRLRNHVPAADRPCLHSWFVPCSLALALVLGSASGCGQKNEKGTRRTALPTRMVKAVPLTLTPMDRTVVVNGTLVAQAQAQVASKVAGRVRELPVDLGSKVERNDLIAQIEQRDFQLKVQQAEAMFAQARALLGLPPEADEKTVVDVEKTSGVRQARALLDEAAKALERTGRLAQENIASEAELETASAAFQVAQTRHQDALETVRNREAMLKQRFAELEIARQQLNDTSVRAPFSGVVQERLINAGEFVAAGAPVVRLVAIDPLRLRLEIPERDAASIRLGQTVRVQVENDTNHYTGRITRLSPSIQEQTRLFLAEADVPNPGTLRPGAFARAEIYVEKDTPALAVPRAAIVQFAGLEKIFLLQDGKALEKRILTGRQTSDAAEVLSVLPADALVVLDPGNLQNGQPITVTR